MTVPSFHPAPKAGTLALIVSEHFKSSILHSYLHPHSSSAHIFVSVFWLSILLVGNSDKSSQKRLGKKTMIISKFGPGQKRGKRRKGCEMREIMFIESKYG